MISRIKKMTDTFITTVGFIALGGIIAIVPVFLLGTVLKNGVENDT